MGGPINREAECDISLLRKLLFYDSTSGKLYWKYRHPDWFRSTDRGSAIAVMWNAAHAGKEAFTATDGHGYRCGSIMNRLYRAQRVCFAIYHGFWPGEVDHRNGRRSDNRITNLADAGTVGNMRNRARDGRNTSGVVGVFRTASGSWQARIGRRGSKDFRQKTVPTKEEAIALRRKWEEQLGYSETHGRRKREYSRQ